MRSQQVADPVQSNPLLPGDRRLSFEELAQPEFVSGLRTLAHHVAFAAIGKPLLAVVTEETICDLT
jgi:hypothetical protein